jgi:hypothetical protein
MRIKENDLRNKLAKKIKPKSYMIRSGFNEERQQPYNLLVKLETLNPMSLPPF